MTADILDVALQMLASFRRTEKVDGGRSHAETTDGYLEQKKSSLSVHLHNCQVVANTATEQMNLITDPDLHEDICLMRAVAMEAILLAQAALRAETLENFNQANLEFQPHYVTLIARVQGFLWDAGPVIRQHLWPLVGKVM